ncbi:AGAP001757-PA-like protein [Anopheles sinensis]|uniref:AGAP001757-PA-like protein n=1 Tax=Anopheles sinensis TaxID=74873 RepID=A0A084W567_ANOSI|nr:AGAP001757-PA-like protein [Anopheles sinensis]
MWTPSYDIIVETLTGSEFEVTVNDRDTVGYLKAEIQKYEGIPVSQQHLLYKHKELSDAMEMKDIPLVKGSRVKLVLGMKGGPISSKRLFTISSDYDNWLDMSDVFSGDDLINLQSPGLKLLLYKDNKKNVHRLMKVRAEKAGDGMKGSSLSRSVIGSGASGQSSGHCSNQKEREATIMKQKMDQIKARLSMKKKRLGGGAALGENSRDMVGEDDGEGSSSGRRPQKTTEDVLGGECRHESEVKLARSQGQYRHKKRHHHHHQHYHHHQAQHETVIKEEKTPIGYRPGASGGGSARGTLGGGGAAAMVVTGGHNTTPLVGAIGSILPTAATTTTTASTGSHHRKSMPAVIDIGRQEQEPAAAPFSYGLVNVLHGSTTATATRTLELEKRSQIREHLQRNRSFKTISAKNLDFSRDCAAHLGGAGGGGGHGGSAGLERSLSFHSNGILNRMNSETTLDGGSSIRRCTNLGHSRGTGIGQSRIGTSVGGCTTTQSLHQLDEKVSSASLHDLIELLKYTHSKQQRTISNDSLNKLVLNYSKKMYMPHLYAHGAGAAGGMKKSLPDINPSLNNIDEYLPNVDVDSKQTTAANSSVGGEGGGGAIPKDLAYKNSVAGGMDKTYRTLCKSISDDNSVYELPKLLVREDSPVESFLGSYSQLETVALRGDSPKNNFTSTTSLQEVGGRGGVGMLDDSETTAATVSESLLELRPIVTKTPATLVGEAKRASESLLQLAQIAAESVKASSVTPPAAAATVNDISPQSQTGGKLFGSSGSLTAGCEGGTVSLVEGGGGNTQPSIGSSWCHHWNHQQQQDNPFLWNLQQVSCGQPQHHQSDLGINELELKFVHTQAKDRAVGEESNGNVIKLPAIPNLEINTSWLSSGGWDSLRFGREDEDADDEALDEEEVGGEVNEHEDDEEADGGLDGGELPEEEDQERVQTSSSCSSIQRPRRATSNSTSFIHSNLSISSDEDDLLNVAHELGGGGGATGGGTASAGSNCGAYKAGGNKSKSIDLNEFRKAFGSSPTLLNGFAAGVGTSCTRLVPQLSRLETIPSQYRRGYTNLNDACLSSSTSELECVSNGASKKKHPLASGGLLQPEDDRSVLSALLKYRKNGNIPYVRSNENLNRYKVSLCGSMASSGGARRRSGDSSTETLGTGGGGDALYLRQQRHQPGAGGSTATGRHLPGIRDHLASIADSELSDSFAAGGNNSVGSNMTEDDETSGQPTNRCFTLDSDFECRFSRLSCCSGPTAGGEVSKSVSPGGAVNGYQHSRQQQQQQQHTSPGLSVIGGGLRTANSSSGGAERNHRLLFGDEGRSSMPRLSGSDGGTASTSTTTTPMRPSDYYFPSDESLFNMDSFFDDFVEIDTSDIFDSTEFININAPGVGGRKGGSQGGSLLLPDIHAQQQQQQTPQQQHHMSEQRQQKSPFSSSSSQYLYFQSKDQRMQGQQQRRVLHTPPPGFRGNNYEDQILKCSTRYAFMHAGGAGEYGDDDDDDEDDVDDDDEEDEDEDEEEDGIASIIQHIDREQLCDEPRRPSAATAGAMSSSAVRVVHGGSGKRHSASSERLLRLQNAYHPPHSSHSQSALVTLPASLSGEPQTTTGSSSTTATTAVAAVVEPEKQKKLRCAQCNKKLGMVMIMKCHCEKVFCAQHRYAEAHNCSYDFRLEGRKVLEKNNPLVVADKLPKI